MRILYVVQRYGELIVGGSEAACRAFAENLAAAGHDVEVLTSCAHNYTDWSDHYAAGTETVNGVVVHRLPVVDIRRDDTFGPLHEWLVQGPHPMPSFEETRWARLMGPELAGQRDWLRGNAGRFDVVVFMTYLYQTTTSGLPTVAGLVPTVLQPTLHKEPPLRARIYDSLFRLPDALMFFTPEERDVVRQRFKFEPVGNVTGIGLDLIDDADPRAFRETHGLGDRPYLLYVGRIDPVKGSKEAATFFAAYKQRNPGPLAFVVAGEVVRGLDPHPDVVCAGFLTEAQKRSAMAGSLALLQPSYFESFSIVLCEAWAQGRPALVQAACAVLDGQARRSQGAIPYRGFAEFEAALDVLTATPGLADAMGRNGHAYVEQNYRWPTVIERVEETLELAMTRFGKRTRLR